MYTPWSTIWSDQKRWVGLCQEANSEGKNLPYFPFIRPGDDEENRRPAGRGPQLRDPAPERQEHPHRSFPNKQQICLSLLYLGKNSLYVA